MNAPPFRCVVCRRSSKGQPVRCPCCSSRASYVLAAVPVVAFESDAPPAKGRRTVPAELAELAAVALLAETLPAPPPASEDGALTVVQASAAAADVEEPERVATLPDLDRVLGGGLCLGRFVLVGGNRGSGKSRLWTHALGRVGGFYASAEEQIDDGALRTKQILTDAERARVGLVHVPAGEGVDRFASLVRRHRPRLAVLDSLQAVAGEQPPQQGRAALALHELSRETGSAIVALSQMNGEGGLRGSKQIEQWCDTILIVERVEGRDSVRVVRCEKNRYGTEDERAYFTHTAKGLVSTSEAVGGNSGN